jgi:hypothetical protein
MPNLSFADKWEKKADMPTARVWFESSTIDGRIFATGGVKDWQILKTNEIYDPDNDKWTKKTDMPKPRVGHSLAVVNGKIFVIGGHSQPGTAEVIDIYNPEKDKWDDPINIPNPRSWISTSMVKNKIYIMGGTTVFNGFGWPPPNFLPLVEEYTTDEQFSVNPQDKLSST